MPKIINFHDIYDEQWFRDTLDVIQESHEIVPFSVIDDFYQGKTKARNQVHLTVDDGHISTYSLIYPVLKERGLTASIFVSPKVTEDGSNFWYFESGDYETDRLRSCIAEVLNIRQEVLSDFYPRSVMKTLTLAQNQEIISRYQSKCQPPVKAGQYMNTEQLLELERSGVFHIGAHTMNHPILANETDEIAAFEIKESVNKLSKILGRPVTTFAYPNGSPGLDFGTREKQLLRECGVQYAFSFEFKDLKTGDDRLSVPRYGLYHGNKDFVRKKIKYGSYWEPVKKLLFNNEDKHRRLIMSKLPSHG